MIVILDTNIFGPKYPAVSESFANLRVYISASGAKLALPGVVLSELSGQYLARVKKINESIGELNNDETKLGIEFHIKEIDLAEAENIFHAHLKEILGSDFEILPNFAEDIGSGIRSVYLGLKPAKDKSNKGIKDTFIWESVKHKANSSDEEIIFISGNSSDFGSNDTLDSYLAEQITNKSFKFFNGLPTFILKYNGDVSADERAKLEKIKKREREFNIQSLKGTIANTEQELVDIQPLVLYRNVSRLQIQKAQAREIRVPGLSDAERTAIAAKYAAEAAALEARLTLADNKQAELLSALERDRELLQNLLLEDK